MQPSTSRSASPPTRWPNQSKWRWVPKQILQAQKNTSLKWIPKINQPYRRGGVAHAHTLTMLSKSKQKPMMVWRCKNSTTTTTNAWQDGNHKRAKYVTLPLARMSAPALTTDAHASHCSMTNSTCTPSLPIAFKHSEVVRVNHGLAQTLLFPPKHTLRDSMPNYCPQDNQKEGGNDWWLTMCKTIRNTSLQVFKKT